MHWWKGEWLLKLFIQSVCIRPERLPEYFLLNWMLKLTGKTLKLLLTTIALPKTEKYNRKSIDLCLKMTIRRYPVSLQNACGPVGISIELNAKTSRDDVKIATDYNCFAKDRKYNRKSINLRLKLTIRRLSRFLHQAFVLLTVFNWSWFTRLAGEG